MSLKAATAKIMCRKWSDLEINELVGSHRTCALAVAGDDKIRLGAASSGVVTALLVYALTKKLIDGVITLSAQVENNQIRCAPKMCSTKRELMDCQGSVYVVVPSWLQKTVQLLKASQGRVAVVGLPCHICLLRRKLDHHPELKTRVFFTIALFCGHTTQPPLFTHLFSELIKEKKQAIRRFCFRIGHWRGQSLVEFVDGTFLLFSSSRYKLYQNLFFFGAQKCLSCADHFGYEADISVGDAWLYELAKEPVKYSSVIIKTDVGEALWADAVQDTAVVVRVCGIEKILEGQRRSALFHHRVSARRRAGRSLGIKVHEPVSTKASFLDIAVAWFMLFNWRWSQGRYAGWIFRIPKPLLKLYLYFIKALESLQ